jgi:hypothetical protein
LARAAVSCQVALEQQQAKLPVPTPKDRAWQQVLVQRWARDEAPLKVLVCHLAVPFPREMEQGYVVLKHFVLARVPTHPHPPSLFLLQVFLVNSPPRHSMAEKEEKLGHEQAALVRHSYR